MKTVYHYLTAIVVAIIGASATSRAIAGGKAFNVTLQIAE